MVNLMNFLFNKLLVIIILYGAEQRNRITEI